MQAIIFSLGMLCVYGVINGQLSASHAVDIMVKLIFLGIPIFLISLQIYTWISHIMFLQRQAGEEQAFKEHVSSTIEDILRNPCPPPLNKPERKKAPPREEPKAQPYVPYTPPPEFDPDYVPEDEPTFSQSSPPKFPCLFNSRQIEQLIDFRQSVNNKDLTSCSIITTHGPYLDNIVPEAGLFTVRINRKKQGLTNLVVMLSTRTAIEEFERFCYDFYTPETDFWTRGYVIELPGQSYCILWVIAARMGGRTIHF
jgi:hypothetical protein